MKKILSIFTVLALSISMNCCSDFIDVKPRGQQTLDNYFATADECQFFVNGIYKRLFLHDDWSQLLAPFLSNMMATDDAWMGSTTQNTDDHRAVAHYGITPTFLARVDGLYRFRYENVSNCNYAIDRIPKAPIAEDLKAYLVAQAKFCRAYNYYELACNFGGMALVSAPIGTSEMNKTRSTIEETWQFIIDDLKDAERDSPNLSPKQAMGRVSKGACQALLARVYLFKGDHANAYSYADQVIKSGIYSLEPNYLDLYSVDNHNGVESIFEIQTAAESDKTVGNQLPTYAGGRGENRAYFPSNSSGDVMDGWGWCMPTSDLENCFLSENDEIRRRTTITRFMEPVYGDEELNPTYYFQPDANKSQRVIRKYYLPIAVRRQYTVDRRRREALNFTILRLAEMYLTRAEAAYYTNNSSQALADINFVRARVNLPPKTGLSGNDLIYAIWKERRMEHAFEGFRLYDIRRQIDPATGKPMIATIMGPNGTFVQYNLGPNADPVEANNTQELQNKGYFFDINKHLLWPIPQTEIDRSMGTITQNPGY